MAKDVHFFVRQRDRRVPEPTFCALPWTPGWQVEIRPNIEGASAIAEVDIYFASVQGDTLLYLHWMRRRSEKLAWGDGLFSKALLQLVGSRKASLLVFHTALTADGRRFVERLRPAPYAKALITLENKEFAETFLDLWAIGSREAIDRHLLEPHRAGPWPRAVEWFT